MRKRWLQGLQWGALAWLGYITAQSVRGTLAVAALWIVALALLLAGSRLARAAVALGILAQLVDGLHEAQRHSSAEAGTNTVISWICFSGLAMCVPMLPLVRWRLHGPRITLALLALGRWRDAWTRAGGVVALLVATATVALNRSILDFLENREPLLFCAVATVLVIARYGEVITTWPARGRQPG